MNRIEQLSNDKLPRKVPKHTLCDNFHTLIIVKPTVLSYFNHLYYVRSYKLIIYIDMKNSIINKKFIVELYSFYFFLNYIFLRNWQYSWDSKILHREYKSPFSVYFSTIVPSFWLFAAVRWNFVLKNNTNTIDQIMT